MDYGVYNSKWIYWQQTQEFQHKQAFDSIAGNTVVPYRSHKKFFNYHKLLLIAIYNGFSLQIENYNYDVQHGHIPSSCRPLKLAI